MILLHGRIRLVGVVLKESLEVYHFPPPFFFLIISWGAKRGILFYLPLLGLRALLYMNIGELFWNHLSFFETEHLNTEHTRYQVCTSTYIHTNLKIYICWMFLCCIWRFIVSMLLRLNASTPLTSMKSMECLISNCLIYNVCAYVRGQKSVCIHQSLCCLLKLCGQTVCYGS